MLREIGLDADAVFDHPDIVAWRKLSDRENCTLDAALADGSRVRWHIKRHHDANSAAARDEVEGIRLLTDNGIPTTPLIGWGRVAGRGAFVISEDLRGFQAADKLLASGMPFERLLQPAADLASRLHAAGLHHRDLYLCHFFVNVEDPTDLRLIDAARVKPLPRCSMFRRRWIVKDLAQFWYSTLECPITDLQREAWLERYATARGIGDSSRLRSSIERKAASIGRHDAKLRRRQPRRNISIPENGA